MRALARRNGDVSFWQASLGAPLARPPLDGDRDADVCIVGGGFTGLWTAYRLARARPELAVVVLERERVGFGASGRNGGWLTPSVAAPRRIAPVQATALERAMRASVADVLAVSAEERIDCDAVAGGVLRFARNRAQAERLRVQAVAARTGADSAADVPAAAGPGEALDLLDA
ncbi:MAG TPA: FAD-dependent oxidoreductase, partial [Conexibacter sp.]